jgi:hypothetical protein
MKNKKDNLAIACAIIFGLLTAITIIFQIATIDSQTTKTEATLFNILQFVFALAFSWILSRISSKDEFEKSQKKFAISAYRRINEIDRSVMLLIKRTYKTNKKNESGITNPELEVIQAIGENIQNTIKSSIADWADIIGEEISTIKKIEKLENEKTELLKENREENATKVDLVLSKFSEQEKKISELINTLPESLQIEKELKKTSNNSIKENIELLKENIKENGGLKLRGFNDKTYDKDAFKKLEVGDKLEIKTSDVAKRVGSLNAFSGKKPIGVIVNKLGNEYHEQTQAIYRVLKTSSFKSIVIEIEDENENGRTYFSVIVKTTGNN